MEDRDAEGRSMNRRRVIAVGAAGAVTAATGALRLAPARAQSSRSAEEGVTAPEDLMKEHGVLNRCLLVYEEGIRRIQAREPVSSAVFHHTADLVRRFVEEYHERNEETYIFPVFQKAGKHTDLVGTLLTQHRAGRAVTREILRLSAPDAFRDAENAAKVAAHCRSFIRMYRPHESREDTILFPALRTILSPRQVESLGERMEEEEQKVLGNEGFEKAVAEVASIEKALGIYDLAQFTPHVPVPPRAAAGEDSPREPDTS
jgi:hemerythrin-like domain-containing protein